MVFFVIWCGVKHLTCAVSENGYRNNNTFRSRDNFGQADRMQLIKFKRNFLCRNEIISLGKNYLDFLNHVYFGFPTLSRYNNTH